MIRTDIYFNGKKAFFLFSFILTVSFLNAQDKLSINQSGYFDMQGLSVYVFNDRYTEGHQGGLSIILNDVRIAANGELRLEPAPGQWQPFSKIGEREVDKQGNTISVNLSYPDSNLITRRFNPMIHPDIRFKYKLNVHAEGKSVRVTVDLEQPLPDEWIGRVGFNLEIFPGEYFEHAYLMDDQSGIISRQFNGPSVPDKDGIYQAEPFAIGKHLVLAPEEEIKRIDIQSVNGVLEFLDGRSQHNNGWYVVRQLVPKGATTSAIEWVITPNALSDWMYKPVIQIPQTGYFPGQKKVAVIECDKRQDELFEVKIHKIGPGTDNKVVYNQKPEKWGIFRRYQYLTFDFSEIIKPGLYYLEYNDSKSEVFRIGTEIFDRHVWQPTLEYFLPVQMCHMRVNDRYRVWHDFCHIDDALMAPTDTIIFDGYSQGSSTLTSFKPYEHVPGLDAGGWHDAGDYDLRVESQARTVRTLGLIYENFKVDYDQTSIDQNTKIVEMHQPDGIPDVLQQMEHGVLTIIGGYKNLGRLYRGIICPTLRQYVMLGDASSMTDNEVGTNKSGAGTTVPDDRWVFTEENPFRAVDVSACLAVASRVLKGYNDSLAAECLYVAEKLWEDNKDSVRWVRFKVEALSELILTTDKQIYKDQMLQMSDDILKDIQSTGWAVARVRDNIGDKKFSKKILASIEKSLPALADTLAKNPFGVPYQTRIWGIGWNVQDFGLKQYLLYKSIKNDVSKNAVFDALQFVLGRHPGMNNSTFVSGVGSKSPIVAYGVNRADWSYIPGGVISGTSYIQPDFPELKEWPFFWQQTEYVLGGGATNYMFLVLAAKQLLSEE